MRKLLLLWLLLTLVLGVASALTSFLVFHHVDLRYETFFGVLLVPVLQAAVLMWARGEWSGKSIAQAAREACRHRAVQALVAADLVILVAVSWLGSRPPLGVAATPGLLPFWTAAKAATAAVLLLTVAARPGRTPLERLAVGGLGVLALALSVARWVHWPELLPPLLPERLPTVLRWLAAYGGLYLLVMAALLLAGPFLARRSPGASFFVELTAAVAFVVALIVVFTIYLRPFILEPWASLVRIGVSLAATGTLGAAWSASSQPDA